MKTELIVDQNYQIVIPKELRDKLNIKPKYKILVKEIDGTLVFIPKPKSYTDFMTGLGKEIWSENSKNYIQNEKKSWD
ncbi:MAG: AbrB/MazE/SpoVT family DNA-binding domain-containing protein [Thermodesulfobacteriota bacterium]